MKNVSSRNHLLKHSFLFRSSSISATLLLPCQIEEEEEDAEFPNSPPLNPGIIPNIQTFTRGFAKSLWECLESGSYGNARLTHAQMLKSDYNPSNYEFNRLIDAYCKSGDSRSAHQVFDEMPIKDVVAFTTLITSYSKSGQVRIAKELFDRMETRDVVSYNAMISGHARDGDGNSAVGVFCEMLKTDVRPDDFTFTSVLSGCADVGDGNFGKLVHSMLIKSGVESSVSVGNALTSMYMKSAQLSCAQQVFDEMTVKDDCAWTTVITGYLKLGDPEKARKFFDMMDRKFGLAWNAMIGGYVHFGLYAEALNLFKNMVVEGMCPLFTSELRYDQRSKMVAARALFDRMVEKDMVSWNAIVCGYVDSCEVSIAYELFEKMNERSS